MQGKVQGVQIRRKKGEKGERRKEREELLLDSLNSGHVFRNTRRSDGQVEGALLISPATNVTSSSI